MITSAYWLAWGLMLGLTAVVVLLAAVSGELSTRRHPPRGEFSKDNPRSGLARSWR